MRLDEAVRRLQEQRDAITAFETDSDEAKGFDSGEALALMGEVASAIDDVLNAWDQGSSQS